MKTTTTKQKDSIVLYEDWLRMAQYMPAEDVKEFISALLPFMTTGELPTDLQTQGANDLLAMAGSALIGNWNKRQGAKERGRKAYQARKRKTEPDGGTANAEPQDETVGMSDVKLGDVMGEDISKWNDDKLAIGNEIKDRILKGKNTPSFKLLREKYQDKISLTELDAIRSSCLSYKFTMGV